MSTLETPPPIPSAPDRPPDRGDAAAALVLAVLGVYGIALWAWVLALVLPIVFGPYEHEAVDALLGLALITPQLALGALALVPAFGLSRARPWARTAAVAWAIIVAGYFGLGLVRQWAPVVGSFGDPDRWYDLAQPQYYLPLPFVVGAIAVIVLVVRSPRWVAILVALALAALLVGGGFVAGAGLQKSPVTPAPTAPTSSSAAAVSVEAADPGRARS